MMHAEYISNKVHKRFAIYINKIIVYEAHFRRRCRAQL